MGGFQFSDPERSIIVASTPDVSKSPVVSEVHASSMFLRKKNANSVKQKPHYSITTQGEKLWGTHDVYADDLVNNARVVLAVTYG